MIGAEVVPRQDTSSLVRSTFQFNDTRMLTRLRECPGLSPGIILPSLVRWDRAGSRLANGSMELPDGPLHVDVWQAQPQARGAMLMFFTGPKNYNVTCRGLAKSMGLALSQNGLADRATGRQLDDGTEEDICRILGLPFLTPHERQRYA